MLPIQKSLTKITWHEAEQPDSLGNWTTGRGFNFLQSGAREVCEACGIDFDDVMALKGIRTPAVTEAQSTALFNHVVNELLPEVRRLIPSFDTLALCERAYR
jgi:hypothetical protein